MRREKRMNESDRAIVRACLDQIELGMVEAREVLSWWTSLSWSRRREWKEFAAMVTSFRRALAEGVHGASHEHLD
jgi:hypothetical protein